ncbi:hypothetical protein BC830DRAFT_1064497 [Chytriomyces sp. MP71]|nr:hypothetical protein BC830DRAFT_1064497 [Chytriomyces sp. MP71]
MALVPKPSPRISIVGAGLAGLCLARVLQKNGITARVYEGEASVSARPQGGWLDMHASTGQRALESAGVARPEIRRETLRRLLLEAGAGVSVRWGHRLAGVASASDARAIELTFANGAAEETDVLVGADGAWSRVRRILSPQPPAYTGVSMWDMDVDHTLDASPSHPSMGALLALDKQGTFLGFNAPHLHLFKRCSHKEEMSALTPEGVVHHWAPYLQQIVKSPASRPPVLRHIVALPVGFKWIRHDLADAPWKSKVTLIGDAAHVMSPFAGEGANLALADACDLGSAIANAVSKEVDISSAILQFEQDVMWLRAQDAATTAERNLARFFGQDGVKGMISAFSN